MVKIDAAVCNFGASLCWALDVRIFVDNFCNAVHTCNTHCNHNEHHGEHHQTHQDIHNVAEQTRQFTSGQTADRNHLRTKPAEGQNAPIHRQHHSRIVKSKHTFSLYKQAIKILSCLLKLFGLKFLPYKGFDHPNGGNIFLNARV